MASIHTVALFSMWLFFRHDNLDYLVALDLAFIWLPSLSLRLTPASLRNFFGTWKLQLAILYMPYLCWTSASLYRL
jgi:hypothetical protein